MGPGQLQPSTLKSSTFLLINTHTFYPSLIKKKKIIPSNVLALSYSKGKSWLLFFCSRRAGYKYMFFYNETLHKCFISR